MSKLLACISFYCLHQSTSSWSLQCFNHSTWRSMWSGKCNLGSTSRCSLELLLWKARRQMKSWSTSPPWSPWHGKGAMLHLEYGRCEAGGWRIAVLVAQRRRQVCCLSFFVLSWMYAESFSWWPVSPKNDWFFFLTPRKTLWSCRWVWLGGCWSPRVQLRLGFGVGRYSEAQSQATQILER